MTAVLGVLGWSQHQNKGPRKDGLLLHAAMQLDMLLSCDNVRRPRRKHCPSLLHLHVGQVWCLHLDGSSFLSSDGNHSGSSVLF